MSRSASSDSEATFSGEGNVYARQPSRVFPYRSHRLLTTVRVLSFLLLALATNETTDAKKPSRGIRVPRHASTASATYPLSGSEA